MPKRLLIRGQIDEAGGYGQITSAIAAELIRRGYEIEFWPIQRQNDLPCPSWLESRIVSESRAPGQLIIWPSRMYIGQDKRRTVHFTMWESSRPPSESIEHLGKCEAVIFPCDWNITAYTAAGLNRPVYKVPLWVDHQLFKYTPPNTSSVLTFGTSGRHQKNVRRKRMEWVIEAFQKAFPTRQDVRMKVKCWESCKIEPTNDPRIQIEAKCMSSEELAAWYRSIDIYVCASAGEAWGLMPHQAMATGRPVIAPRYGGLAEFFNEYSGWELDYNYGKSELYYAGHGVWANVDRESLISTMTQAAGSRSIMTLKSAGAYRQAGKFSLTDSVDKLEKILLKHQIVY